MLKRSSDITISLVGLLVFSPLLIFAAFIVFLQDFHNPLYIATRVGKNKKPFKMVKLRSMIVDAEKSGVDSTSSDDKRISWIGRFIRRIKLDEITQLLNVLIGNMSLVGPRPNVERDVSIYTDQEFHLLDVHPGITDFSSIVFSDEGKILSGSEDPDLEYNQLIRPWKSRLGLFYVEIHTLLVDIKLILITVLALVSRRKALVAVSRMLGKLGAPVDLVSNALREKELIPTPPPGALDIVKTR